MQPDSEVSVKSAPDIAAIAAGTTAFVYWGIIPIFWKLASVDSMIVVCHRVVWSLLTLFIVLLISGEIRQVAEAVLSRKLITTALPAALLIGSNWLIFIWAVQHDRVIDTSLGYFLNPLCNVVIAVVFLGERINAMQKLAIGVAFTSVGVFALASGGLPWISLVLALTFSLYSLVKKQSKMTAGVGLSVETIVLAPLAVGWLLYTAASQPSYNRFTELWLVAAGPVTTLPLFLFAFAARRTSLVTIGMLQYLGPTLQLLIGWGLYNEPMTTTRWIVFGMVWVSLAIYSFDLIRRASSNP